MPYKCQQLLIQKQTTLKLILFFLPTPLQLFPHMLLYVHKYK